MKKITLLLPLLTIFTCNFGWSQQSFPIETLSPELEALGFELISEYWGTDAGTQALRIPINLVEYGRFLTGNDPDKGIPYVFSELGYALDGETAIVNLRTTARDSAEFRINLNNYDMEIQVPGQPSIRGRYTRFADMTRTLAEYQDYYSDLDWRITGYDHETEQLYLANNNYLGTLNLNLHLPSSIILRPINDYFILLEDTDNCDLMHDAVFRSGEDTDIDYRHKYAFLDLGLFLNDPLLTEESTAAARSFAYSNSQFNRWDANLNGNLQEVINYFVHSHYDCELQRIEAEQGPNDIVTSDGYRRFVSQSGRSTIFVNPESQDYPIIPGYNWSSDTQIITKPNGEYLFVDPSEDNGGTFSLQIEVGSGTYTVNSVE